MAERPASDTERQRASYSPPPNHRPTWIGNGWGAAPGTPATSEQQAGHDQIAATQPVQPPRRRDRGGVAVAMALVAAMFASGSTYVLLLASGQLDRQVVISSPLGQPAGAARQQVDPDVVRVVEQSAVTDAVDRVSPAVVTITPRMSSSGFISAEGTGSGVIYDQDGWVITNRHVVCNAESLSVQLADGQNFEGEIHGLDTLTDLAIVKIDARNLPFVALGNSSTLRVGQDAIAIGSPLGTFTNSVTTGVVSALGRNIDVDDGCRRSGSLESLHNLIQTDAAINPGNSGGALVDSSGTLIGINTAIAGDAQGIGFAIPINLARPIMQQAVEGESLSRPWVGIYYTALTPVLQDQRNLQLGYGALVEPPSGYDVDPVFPGSPAADAGLRSGDIITYVDATKVDGDNPLDEILTQYGPRESVNLRVLRGDELIDLELRLGTRPTNQ